ncbi:Phosphopantothenoylcysteine synthetase/decarboxylase [hydrothermal vent metagenome]|uniref:Phosphopantothenoylcysteine synthetase/decarboxylase n=1 Tax=hydrothermal vent metagenome TaxID=652676 RepID=A0A3B0YNQ9_9ZZZZ
MKALLCKGLMYWHTLKYLKPVQIVGRFRKVFKRARVDLSPTNGRRAIVGEWFQPAQRSQRMRGERTFCFLNETHEIKDKADWNNIHWPKLWLYNLHYFDDLASHAAAQRKTWHCALIDSWIQENPAGNGNGWEPYPSSLRIVNWIKWALAGNVMEQHWLQSLAVQARFLQQNIEYHLLGNHLFANAKALMFAGLFLKDDASQVWYETGVNILKRELPEQVLKDGGNFELSPMYHQIFLEDLLDLFNIHEVFNRRQVEGVVAIIPDMFYWLQTMCHPDNKISFFNDSAFDVTPSVQELEEYGTRLGFDISNRKGDNDPALIVFADSGYTRVQKGEAFALIDRAAVGPDYLPGHAHADTLSFELSLFGQRFIVNSGTSVYGGGADRMNQRGTAAHSTIVIDEANSSEVWSGFRVARRARVLGCTEFQTKDLIKLVACHDGYNRLPGRPMHCREWLFGKDSLLIIDCIKGRGVHLIKSILPLHPNVKVSSVTNNSVVLGVHEQQVLLSVEGEGRLEISQSEYHPEFGISVANKKLVFNCKDSLPVEIKTRISW